MPYICDMEISNFTKYFEKNPLNVKGIITFNYHYDDYLEVCNHVTGYVENIGRKKDNTNFSTCVGVWRVKHKMDSPWGN